jgi:hypothetical protein
MYAELPIMDYENHSAIENVGVFVDKLAAFALSKGFTIREKQIAKNWVNLGGGVYGWANDVANPYPEHYLEIEKHDYQYRFRFRPRNNINIQLTHWEARPFAAGTNYATTATHPVLQTADMCTNYPSSFNYEIPIPTNNFYDCWFFGDSDVIYWIVRFDATCVHAGWFGRQHTFETSSVYGGIAVGSERTSHSTDLSISDVKAQNDYIHPYFTATGASNNMYFLHKNRALRSQYSYEIRTSISFLRTNLNESFSIFTLAADYHQMARIYNNHAETPLIWRNEIFIKDTPDNLTFHAGYFKNGIFLARYPERYAIGEQKNIDTQEYMIFPMKDRLLQTQWANVWVAFRIA